MQKPWLNTSLPVEERVSLLLQAMELSEKIGQMEQLNNVTVTDRDQIVSGAIGSVILASSMTAGNERDTGVHLAGLNAMQKLAVEESRLGIPLLFARDVIHGHRTVFPVPLGQAASWSPELVGQAAEVSAREAYANGIRWVFTPMLDISRDPRWGRITEGFGEDPYLASELARSAIKGYQGDDMTQEGRVAACAKHYAGYGGVEGGRDYNTVDIGYRSLFDNYLPPFQAAVDAGLATIMSAFNEIDGVPATANEQLIRGILKDSWKFDGVVVSDWTAIKELISHGIAGSEQEAAFKAIMAGIDIDMVSSIFSTSLARLVEAGAVPVAHIDDAVKRILRLKFRLGLFENPLTDPALEQKYTLTQANRALARELVCKSSVLLKNNGILPLDENKLKNIMLTGPLARSRTELYGTWTLDGRSEETISVEEALEQLLPSDTRMHVQINYTDEIVRLARWMDVVIACVGEHPHRSGEANSISTLDLPPGQMEYLRMIRRMNAPIIAVVFAGRPLALEELHEIADAVLYVWHPGIEGANAICDILFGRTDPGGRLPLTFPRTVGQIPVYYNHKPTGRPLPQVRYFGRYNDCLDQPLYPFGYGLSYAAFEYSGLKLKNTDIAVSGSLELEVTVTNTSDRPGDTVVQVYIRDMVASVSRPVRELKAFQRLTLAAGETVSARFSIPVKNLSFCDEKGNRVIEPGEFTVWVGQNSTGGLSETFRVKAE